MATLTAEGVSPPPLAFIYVTLHPRAGGASGGGRVFRSP